MNNRNSQRVVVLALLCLGMRAPGAPAAPARTPGPVATVADRRVEEADIRRAALVMADDPLRATHPAAWRKKLLDLCVDRELLALEAERTGFTREGAVARAIDRASAEFLFDQIRQRFLVPEITPSASQIDTARAGGLFRRVRIGYILSVTDKKVTYDLMQAIRHGASFDSIARLYSLHPSAGKGGEVGWKLVGELNAASWKEFGNAKPGDLLGPYVNAQAHEFYILREIHDPDDAEIRNVLMHDRLLELESRYHVGLLQKYHFRLSADAVANVLFTAATEKPESILASLDADGHRPKREVRPALGTLATVDGDSLDYRDISDPEVLTRDPDGRARIEDSRRLLQVCTVAVLPRLVARDARERGVDKDPAVARRLRLIREEISTRAMVGRAVPPPDSAAVRAWYDAHRSSYRRPPARRANVAIFQDPDTARAALAGWSRPSARDSVYELQGFRRSDRLTAGTLFPRWYGTASLLDTDMDPVSVAVRGLKDGELSSLIETPNGYAVAEPVGREEARPYTFEETRIRAEAEARDAAENAWVMNQLERLRAATPARTAPARLAAVRLGVVTK